MRRGTQHFETLGLGAFSPPAVTSTPLLVTSTVSTGGRHPCPGIEVGMARLGRFATREVGFHRATAYVVVVAQSGNDVVSRPCDLCRRELLRAGVRHVVWSNRGEIREEWL